MASSPKLLVVFVVVLTVFVAVIPAPALSQTACTTQKFKGNHIYAKCLDVPALLSYLHYTYDAANATLSIAFVASPSEPNGWISWAINPAAPKMVGSQALVAYVEGYLPVVRTYNVSSFYSVDRSPLSFEVWDTGAEADASSRTITMFAKVKVPAELAAKGRLHHVWQVGPIVDSSTGGLAPHPFAAANLASVGTLQFAAGKQSANAGNQSANAGGGDSRTKRKNIHGILNAVSWGFLLPMGVMIARYLKVFEMADTSWFYLHVACQLSAYAVGAVGWAIGMKLGSESHDIVWSAHRKIGITLFSLTTIQLLTMFLRPNKDHAHRFYWNMYHWVTGYVIVILSIVNIFKGFNIFHPDNTWKIAYIVVISVLFVASVLLEVATWTIVLGRRRRWANSSTKPDTWQKL